jgi:hypothetical protein
MLKNIEIKILSKINHNHLLEKAERCQYNSAPSRRPWLIKQKRREITNVQSNIMLRPQSFPRKRVDYLSIWSHMGLNPFTVNPPSVEISCPVMSAAAGRQRNPTRDETSFGSPSRWRGVHETTLSKDTLSSSNWKE